jgi:hypothetical protein
MSIIHTYLDQGFQLQHKEHFDMLFNQDDYKYELLKNISVDCSEFKVLLKLNIEHDYYSIRNGIITGKKGYRWDGCSGPTKDDETNMRASLPHDITYQAFTEALQFKELSWFTKFKIRRAIDKVFRRILKADGMKLIRRQGYYIAVRGAGAFFAYF